MKALVVMDAEGCLTLPEWVRRALGVSGESLVEVEVVDGKMFIRPASAVPREDAWAYTVEHRALVERARADVAAGRIVSIGKAALMHQVDH